MRTAFCFLLFHECTKPILVVDGHGAPPMKLLHPFAQQSATTPRCSPSNTQGRWSSRRDDLIIHTAWRIYSTLIIHLSFPPISHTVWEEDVDYYGRQQYTSMIAAFSSPRRLKPKECACSPLATIPLHTNNHHVKQLRHQHGRILQ